MTDSPLVYSPLSDLGFLRVGGEDAAAFLHGQLTVDVTALGVDRAPLAGWCDPRGRLLALVRLLRHGGGFLLLAPRDGLPALVEQLSRFVLRARVELVIDTELKAAAVLGPAAAWLARHGMAAAAATNALLPGPDAVAIRLGDELVELIGSDAALAALLADLEAVSADVAELAEIRLGLPTLGAATTGRYIPQMLNLDLLDAVSFDKGCYPGQEIVARTQNLGAVKRRLRRFTAATDTPPPAGTEIQAAGGERVGAVIRAARGGDGIELLGVVSLDALAGALHLAGREDSPLHELPLPY